MNETALQPGFFPAAIVLRAALEAKVQACVCFMLLCETPAQVYFLFHRNMIAGFHAGGRVVTGRTGFLRSLSRSVAAAEICSLDLYGPAVVALL